MLADENYDVPPGDMEHMFEQYAYLQKIISTADELSHLNGKKYANNRRKKWMKDIVGIYLQIARGIRLSYNNGSVQRGLRINQMSNINGDYSTRCLNGGSNKLS